jgi:phosphopantothenoylcysteine decarboxylase/phosphopantothenate--cysteine ligase
MNTLINKRILVGVSGGIAAYKSCYLVRRLIEQGAEVEVVMTRGSKEFVTPLTFQALSGRPVHTRLLDHDAESAMGHISLARWADAIIVAPAMNRLMWENPATQENIKKLKAYGITIVGPGMGQQACGEIGMGRMIEPDSIQQAVNDYFRSKLLTGRKVLITAGPTRESIDPVRYITNHSSGRMGYAIAQAAIEADAQVTLISGPVTIQPPERAQFVSVTTASEMETEVIKNIENADIFISAAAVADYRCIDVSEQKIKKSDNNLTLRLEKTPDIISSVKASKNNPFTVGFAAETDQVSENAKSKLTAKGIDMIAANQVGPGIGFESEINTLDVFWKEGHADLGTATKQKLARDLIKLIANRINEKHSD